MKLNKSQRHTAYIILLAEANNILKNKAFDGGLCLLIAKHLDESPDEWNYNDLDISDFEELDAKEPEYSTAFWFPKNYNGWIKRINILQQCIEETY